MDIFWNIGKKKKRKSILNITNYQIDAMKYNNSTKNITDKLFLVTQLAKCYCGSLLFYIYENVCVHLNPWNLQ